VGDHSEERELVGRVLRDDQKAAQELVESYRDYMYRTCANILGYRDPDAEDMVQEAFIVAFKKLPGFEFRAPLKSWLAQICVYLCYRHIRKRTHTVMMLNQELEALDRSTAVERVKNQETQKEKLNFLEECLKKIGEECRRIVLLRDREEKSYADIGRALKIPIGTVMSRLSRCKEALKTLALQALKEEKNG
jgi:RNA polymerase sigma-70 factor (ECF subfamily)